MTRQHRGFTHVHPPGLSLTRGPWMGRGPFGLNPGFAPRSYPQRTPGREQATEHWPGITSPPSGDLRQTYPLDVCDLVSHGGLHPVPGPHPGRPQAAPHHQRDREPELPAPQGHQGQRPLPPPTTPSSSCCGWPSSTSRTSAPASGSPAAPRPASAQTSPPSSSKDSASCAGARPSASSTPPTQDGSDDSLKYPDRKSVV